MLEVFIAAGIAFGIPGIFFYKILTNKDRLCEQSEPQSYPVVGQARHVERGLNISKYLF